MKLSIVNCVETTIPVDQMQDGQIAIIVNWNVTIYIGSIVQRYDKHLICLGAPSLNSWPYFFEGEGQHVQGHRVQLLPSGTMLRVE